MKDTKTLNVEFFDTTRAVCNFVNTNAIKREDIVSLITENHSYILFYYK